MVNNAALYGENYEPSFGDIIAIIGDPGIHIQTIFIEMEVPSYTLTIDIVGSGSVSKDPDQSYYSFGDVVELTAVADLGWTFVGWSGDLSGSVNPESIVMYGDSVVTATFSKNIYNLSLNIIGNGSVLIIPDWDYFPYGTSVNLTAIADKGWDFDYWSNDLTGKENPVTIIMDNSKSINATFYKLNIPPYAPSNPNPGDGQKDVGINTDLSWIGGDPDPFDTVTYDVFFGSNNPPPIRIENQSLNSFNIPTLDYYTKYYWQIVAWDNHNSSNTSGIWSFTTSKKPESGGNDNPTAVDDEVFTNINTEIWIDVLENDHDSDGVLNPSTVEITDPPSNGTTTIDLDTGEVKYKPDEKFNGIDSFIYVVRDDYWALSNKATVIIKVGGVRADATAGEPYFGFPGEDIIFNGQNSYDPDSNGYIVEWFWEFGDGTTGLGEIVKYKYLEIGHYNVTLTVTDNEGYIDTDEVEAIITIANNPPSEPIVDGPIYGGKNETYNFTALSYDLDNDTIKYIINWDDGTTAETSYLPNGTLITRSHSWTKNGVFRISIKATDGIVESTIAEHVIAIDVIVINKIKGCLVDEDDDGKIDYFENLKTGRKTNVKIDNFYYLINDDDDDQWDHAFNETEGLISYYEFVYNKYFVIYQEEMKAPGFEFVFLLIMITFAFIIYKRKKLIN